LLDEAQKAAIALMHWKEFMTDSGTKLRDRIAIRSIESLWKKPGTIKTSGAGSS
jgi:hypothetical protein